MRKIKRVNYRLTTKFFLTIFLAILAFFILLGLVRSWQTSIFSGANSFSWAVISDKGKIVVVAQQGKESVGSFLVVPSNLRFLSAKNLGSYPTSSLYALGEQQGVGGGELVKQTLQENLNIPVDAFFYTNNDLEKQNAAKLGWEVKKTVIKSALLNQGETDLGWFDQLTLAWFLSTQKISSWAMIDLNDYLSVNDDGLFDLPVSEKIKDMLLYAFADQYLFSQNLKLGVVNNTDCSQAANKTIKLLGNLGIYGVPLTNNKLPLSEESRLMVRPDLKLPGAQLDRISRILQAQVSQPDSFIWQEELILVIGKSHCHLSD